MEVNFQNFSSSGRGGGGVVLSDYHGYLRCTSTFFLFFANTYIVASPVAARRYTQAVEDRVVRRVSNKAATYGQDISEDLPDAVAGLSEGRGIEYKVAPERVGELYYKWIMPMTKDVQVEYLLRRLDHL